MWGRHEQALYWIDWSEDQLFRWEPETGDVRVWSLPATIGCFVLHRGGGAVLALATGFHRFDFTSGETSPIVDPDPAHPTCVLNDGGCDRRGRFWAGTMADPLGALPAELDEENAIGALFCLDPDLGCRNMGQRLFIPNGIVWSPDDRTLYFADSPRRAIFAARYHLDEGELSDVRQFATIDGPGVPDGAAVDTDGFVWYAIFNGSRLERYDPLGRRDRVVELPVSQPTSIAFGGARLDAMYVTTARYGLSDDELAKQPMAGRLLAVAAGVSGEPETLFGG